MLLGYNTNGFAFHKLADTIEIVHSIGYQAVGLTVDHHVLNPFADEYAEERQVIHEQLQLLQLRNVVETGARFLLDPWRKHQPTLLSPTEKERKVRIDFLCRCVELAQFLGSDALSFWTGTPLDDPTPEETVRRLVESLQPVLDSADKHDVVLALEPEPGMHIATMEHGAYFLSEVNHPLLKLTMDVGHLHCLEEGHIPDLIHKFKNQIANVHIEDMRREVHDHLMFGDGEMEFRPILKALEETGYQQGVYVELSRHAHDAVRVAEASYTFLKGQLAQNR